MRPACLHLRSGPMNGDTRRNAGQVLYDASAPLLFRGYPNAPEVKHEREWDCLIGKLMAPMARTR
jgi:hypothetical protein